MTWRLEHDALRGHGSAPALTGCRADLDYATLAGRAAAVADALEDAGVGHGDRVALLSAGRAHDEPVALAGILAARAVAVPLDPTHPPARLDAIARSSGCRAVVHDPGALRRWNVSDRSRIEVDEDGFVLASAPTAGGSTAAPDPTLAAVLHTSGSTGSPKPVPVTWEGLDAFTAWMTGLVGLEAGSRVLRVAELTFDLAWFDHLATLRAGATLCTMTRRELTAAKSLAAAVERLAPEVIYGVPSLFIKLGAALEALPEPIRALCYAGEVFPPAELAKLYERAGEAPIHNLFGPTETNVCTYHRIRRQDCAGDTPIGVSTPYAECRLVDEGRVVEGPGTGELVVRGPTALGGEHWTRDRVERGHDGLFYFRGRIDRMVKVRGYRVEPGEVEAALCSHPWVREAAVLPEEHPRLGRTLGAFVALREGDRDAAPRTLRKHVSERLAPYMMPERVTVLDALPRATTGKIDYAALASD